MISKDPDEFLTAKERVSQTGHFLVSSTLNMIPGWVFVGLAIAGSATWKAFSNNSNLIADMAHWSTFWPDLRASLLVGAVALFGYLKQDPWTKKDEKE